MSINSHGIGLSRSRGRHPVRRTTTAALAVTMLLAAAQPASAGGHHGGARVTGTYSTGPAHAWEPLPVTRVGDDDGAATDATVVVDPSQARQRYAGIGFSLDETSVSNLWK